MPLMQAPPVIETPRLRLSVPTAADADAMFARYASDAEVTRFLSWPQHRSVDDTRAFVAFSEAEWQRWPAGPYLIRARSDGRLLGGTGLTFDAPDAAMTGYVLTKDAWGQGYATEALTAMVDLAGQLGVRRLFAVCHPEHRASQRVLEKCGFARDLAWTALVEFPNLAPDRPQPVFCFVRHFEAGGASAAAGR